MQQGRQSLFFQQLHKIYDQYYLSEFQKFAVTKFIKDNMGRKDNTKTIRARDWLLLKINSQRHIKCHQWQRGCPDLVPGLRATPWWNPEQFPWFKHFEENLPKIQEQVMKLRNQKGFQPYRGPSWISGVKAKDGVGKQSVDSGQWNVFYLYLHDIKFQQNCAKVPLIMEFIQKFIPRNYYHAFISAVTPKTHIMKHYGPTNKKLRFHFPIMGIEGSRLRVADQIKQQQIGKCYVFDDSFQHQAWHDGQATRIILIVDFWHPDLTIEEIKFFNLLQKAKLKAQKQISELDPSKDNFFSIIDQAKQLLGDNDWWTINSPIINK